MPDRDLSIVIITKDTRDLVESLIGSIYADRSLAPLLREVIVIDNASSDGTGDMLKTHHPSVEHVYMNDNRGFSVAANNGFRRAQGKYILFLNSDTILIKGETEKMIAFLEKNPNVGILGPQLVHADMGLQRSFAFVPSLLFEFVPESIIKRLAPSRYPNPKKAHNRPFDVASLIGAAIIVRKKAMEAVNGFDERFFFFLEETDLCLRIREKGFRVVFFPGSSVIHLQGKTVSKRWVQGRIEYAISLYKFIGKHHGFLYSFVFRAIRFLKSLLYIIVFAVIPLYALNKKNRKRYHYYAYLFLWHLKGCRDDMGLKN